MDLTGKTALIVGATSAIARATARLLAADGAALYLMGRSTERLEAARADLLAEFPTAAIGIHLGNSADPDAIALAATAAHEWRGRLDICLATPADTVHGALLSLDAEQFASGVNGCLMPMFGAIRHCGPLMGEGGAIVCVSSIASDQSAYERATYAIGKAAIERLVTVAAAELGPRGIRVNAVRPGLTRAFKTGGMLAQDELVASYLRRIPLGRTGESDDLARVIRFLAGPESAWVTGQSLAADGGQGLYGTPDP